MNVELFESHLKHLNVTYRKDLKDGSKFRYDGVTLSIEDLSKRIAEKVKYNFADAYKDETPVQLESDIQSYIVNKYKKGVINRAKNQLTKTADISLKNKITSIQGIEPTHLFNDEDKRMWSKFYHCKEDNAFYLYDGLKFHYVSACLPSEPKEIRAFIADNAKYFNPDFYTNFITAVAEASELSILVHNTLKVQDAQSILIMPGFKEIAALVDDEHKQNTALLTEDYYLGLIIKDLFDNKTPSTIWRGFARLQAKNQEVYDHETDKKILTWNGFYASTLSNVAVTVSKYIDNILVNYSNELVESISQLEKKPLFISMKEGVNALNIYDKNWTLTVNKQTKPIEQTMLWTYLNTLSETQRKYVCAWCYNTVIPNKLEPINLVLWDLGGTGKTSLLSQTVRLFTKRIYDNDYYYIKGDDFEKPTSRYNPLSNRDIGDAIFSLIDDIDTSILEGFANVTGSGNNSITCKKLYSNEYQKPNYTKYILATNNALSIKRIEAFRRRIAIIHTYACNTFKQALTDEEFEAVFNEDAISILLYWKDCYKEIIEKYSTLTNAASQIEDIAPELENATDVEENLNEAVQDLLEVMRLDSTNNSVRMSNNLWKTKLEEIIGANTYMKNITVAQVRNKLKLMSNVKINQHWRENGKTVAGIEVTFEDTDNANEQDYRNDQDIL